MPQYEVKSFNFYICPRPQPLGRQCSDDMHFLCQVCTHTLSLSLSDAVVVCAMRYLIHTVPVVLFAVTLCYTTYRLNP